MTLRWTALHHHVYTQAFTEKEREGQNQERCIPQGTERHHDRFGARQQWRSAQSKYHEAVLGSAFSVTELAN